jgi:hypothetical protein
MSRLEDKVDELVIQIVIKEKLGTYELNMQAFLNMIKTQVYVFLVQKKALRYDKRHRKPFG